MINLLLPSNKSTKINLLYLFYNQQNLNIEEISNTLNCSKRTVSRYINELNTEIFELMDISNLIIKDSSKTCYLNHLFREQLPRIYGEINYLYLKDSTSFNIILLILSNGSISIDEVCDSLYISKSHAYHLIQELNILIMNFGIKIGQNADKKLVFIGNEINIRVFLYSIFISGIPNSIWLFPIPKERIYEKTRKIINGHDISEYSFHNLLILCSILHCRLSNGFSLSLSFVTPLIKDLEKFQIDSLCFEDYFSNYSLSSKMIVNEELMFTVFIQILFNDIVSPEKIIQVAETIVQTNSEKIIFLNSLIEQCKIEFSLELSLDQSYQFIYYYSLFLMLSVILGQLDLIGLLSKDVFWEREMLSLDSYRYSKKKIKKVLDGIEEIYISRVQNVKEKKLQSELMKTFNIHHFSRLTYILFTAVKTKVVFIHLHFTKDYFTGKFVKDKLIHVFQNNIIEFTEDVNNASLIITDNTQVVSDKSNIIFIDNILNSEQLSILLASISKIYVKLSSDLFRKNEMENQRKTRHEVKRI